MEIARPSWDETWMTMARELAKRSHDPTYQVGALVVTRENTQVLSLGYNGNFPGGPHVRESMAPGESGFIHAEVNALIKLDFNHPSKKIMYVTLSPCAMCAKLIMAAKVEEVVFADKYRDTAGIELLRMNRVNVRQFTLPSRPVAIREEKLPNGMFKNWNGEVVKKVRYATNKDGTIAKRHDGSDYVLSDNDVQMGHCVDGSPLVAGRDEPADDWK